MNSDDLSKKKKKKKYIDMERENEEQTGHEYRQTDKINTQCWDKISKRLTIPSSEMPVRQNTA